MSVVIVNDSGSQTYLGRTVGISEFPSDEFSLTWQTFHTVIRAVPAFHTDICVAGASGFIGGNEYFTASGGDGATNLHYHVGLDGGDTFDPTHSRAAGVWYREAFQRLKNGAIWETRYWFDLDGGTGLVIQPPDDSGQFAWASDTTLCFGSVPYINNEGITAYMRCLKAWSVPRTLAELDEESRSGVIRTSNGTTNLWGQWPCVDDGRDISGNNRPLTPSIFGGSLTFDHVPDPSDSGRSPNRIIRPRLFAPGRAR